MFDENTQPELPKVRRSAESLDAARASANADGVGTTALYNVASKARLAEVLTPRELEIYEQADVATLIRLHDEIDAAVAAAYGWPWPMTDSEILERVVALNAERVAEEAAGKIRWLRPDYQIPLHAYRASKTAKVAKPACARVVTLAGKPAWPSTMTGRISAIRTVLRNASAGLSLDEIARSIAHAPKAAVAEILGVMVALSDAARTDDGMFYST
ncbi:MAG: hypothetical protein WC205_16925 [Opitutaceae bacterium]|jgi:hypothetical protein